MGKQAKINKDWLKAIEHVLNEDDNAVVLTDEQLFIMTNEHLKSIGKEDCQVAYRTAQDYKLWIEPKHAKYQALLKEFRMLYKIALIKQKINLFKNLKKEDKARQKYAWIIERKFSDWNLRNITYNIPVEKEWKPLDIKDVELLSPQEIEAERQKHLDQ